MSMSLERAVEIGLVIINARADLHRLRSCKKVLVAPDLFQAMNDKLKKQQEHVVGEWPHTGQLFFMGVPVVECDDLEGLEYALVRS